MKVFFYILLFTNLVPTSYACSRYFITYIENDAKDMDVAMSLQEQDLKAIFDKADYPVPQNCRYFINGEDLHKDESGNSRLTRIYNQIANDGSQAPVDFFTVTHGSGNGEIEVLPDLANNQLSNYLSVKEAFFDDIPNSIRNRLGVFADMACWGIASSLQATEAGFSASIGNSSLSLAPLALRSFFENYLKGLSLENTSRELLQECLTSDIWKTVIEIEVHQRREDYCRESTISIIGDPNIDINFTSEQLVTAKTNLAEKIELLGQISIEAGGFLNNPTSEGESIIDRIENSENCNAFFRASNPYTVTPLQNIQLFSQIEGDREVQQVEVELDYRLLRLLEINNVSVTSEGNIGFNTGIFSSPLVDLVVLRRNPRQGIEFGFTLLSIDKTWLVLGSKDDSGLSWKYSFSTDSNLGYLVLKDKEGNNRRLADIGVNLNNELDLRYNNLSLETEAGYDFMVFHPTQSPTYANASLMYSNGGNGLGAYAEYNGITGSSAGLKASLSIRSIFAALGE